MKTGTVIRFNKIKGYGFIKPDDSEEEVFVHYTAIESSNYKELKPEQKVSFEVEDNGRGPSATNVNVIS